MNFYLARKDLLQVTVRPKPERMPPNLNTQVILASHVTAFSRIQMALAIRQARALGHVVIYSDTDSLVLKVPRHNPIGSTKWTPPPMPFTISDSYRCWKFEVEGEVRIQFGHSFYLQSKFLVVLKIIF